MRNYSLFFAWLIALIALLATLFASEILKLPVCVLCWYQRICIYPLVILLGMAAYRNDNNIAVYAMPFSIIGFCFAVYQYCEQMIPNFSPIAFCTQAIPCNTIHFKLLGFITFPFLSAIACLFIFIFLMYSEHNQQRN